MLAGEGGGQGMKGVSLASKTQAYGVYEGSGFLLFSRGRGGGGFCAVLSKSNYFIALRRYSF